MLPTFPHFDELPATIKDLVNGPNVSFVRMEA